MITIIALFIKCIINPLLTYQKNIKGRIYPVYLFYFAEIAENTDDLIITVNKLYFAIED